MPEDMAPTPPVTPPQGTEQSAPPLTTEQVMADAATAAGNIVDAAHKTPEGQAAQSAAQISAAAEAVGLTATLPTSETAVTDASSSLSQSNRAAVRVVPSDVPQATPWPAPAKSEAFVYSNQAATSPEATAEAATATLAQAEAVAQKASDISWKNNQAGAPTPYSLARVREFGKSVVGEGPDPGDFRMIASNKIADARNMVAASQVEGDATVQAPDSEAPIGNPTLDAVLTDAYGDPATKSVEGAAVMPPQPTPSPTQTEVFDAQMAQKRAGATWPEIQTPAAGAAVPAEAQPTTTETEDPEPDRMPITTTTEPVSTEAIGETTTTPSAAETTVPPVTTTTTTTTTTEAPPTTPTSTTPPPSIPPTA